MKIRKSNLFSDFHFQIENEKWKSLSDFRCPFSNKKRKSELWNSTRTLQVKRTVNVIWISEINFGWQTKHSLYHQEPDDRFNKSMIIKQILHVSLLLTVSA